MQHVDLSVDNLCGKCHEVLIKNKQVLGPSRKNMNCLLETGSAETGSWQREIPYALLIAIEWSLNFVSDAYGFSQNQPEIMSRKRKIIIIIKKENNNRSFRPSRKTLIIEKKKPKNNNKVFRWDGRP